MDTKMMKFEGLDAVQEAESAQQANVEELIFGVSETTNLETAAKLFQVVILSSPWEVVSWSVGTEKRNFLSFYAWLDFVKSP